MSYRMLMLAQAEVLALSLAAKQRKADPMTTPPTESEIAGLIEELRSRQSFVAQGPAYLMKLCGRAADVIEALVGASRSQPCGDADSGAATEAEPSGTEINARLAAQRQDGFAGLREWLYTYRAHLMDTGYHGFFDALHAGIEAWLETIETAQAVLRRSLTSPAHPSSCPVRETND